jgi:hypothetical protein
MQSDEDEANLSSSVTQINQSDSSPPPGSCACKLMYFYKIEEIYPLQKMLMNQ